MKQLIKSEYCVINFVITLALLGFSMSLEAAQILPANLENGSRAALKLGVDEVAIFGYGSLMLESEIERTLQKPYNGPFIVAILKGFERVWSAQHANQHYYRDKKGVEFIPKMVTYLNIEPSENSKINGILFTCSKADLKLFDERESPYDRVKINDFLEDISIIGGDAYTYVGKPECTVSLIGLTPKEAVISERYVGVIQKALDVLGKNFSDEYAKNTAAPPSSFIFKEE